MRTSFSPTLILIGCWLSFGVAVGAEAPELENNPKRSALDAMEGKPAPALVLKEWMNSKPLTLAGVKGKIVVLDFWATWCGPCIAAIPHNNQLAKKYADKGVVFIGVCAMRGAEKMTATAKAKGIAYPIAADDGGATVKAYGVNSYPDYYIIDRNGNLRWADLANKDVEKAIELLLKEAQTSRQ